MRLCMHGSAILGLDPAEERSHSHLYGIGLGS